MSDRPEPFDVEALERAVNDSAGRISAIWISFLIFSLYLLIAAGTVTPRQLFLDEPTKLPVLNIDMPWWWITASGEWVNDRTHGQQFRARFLRTSPPTSADGIEKYLSSGMIRGIGPVYAKKLVRSLCRGMGQPLSPGLCQQI